MVVRTGLRTDSLMSPAPRQLPTIASPKLNLAGLAIGSHPVVGRVVVVLPDLRKACLTGLGRSLRKALLCLAFAKEIDEVFNLSQALRRKLFDLVEQGLVGGIHGIDSFGVPAFTCQLTGFEFIADSHQLRTLLPRLKSSAASFFTSQSAKSRPTIWPHRVAATGGQQQSLRPPGLAAQDHGQLVQCSRHACRRWFNAVGDKVGAGQGCASASIALLLTYTADGLLIVLRPAERT